MFSIWSISLIAILYLGVLFGIAWYVERNPIPKLRPWIYSLTLGIYCTSWSFYGTSAQAAQNGWWLALTYAGSIVLFILFWRIYLRVADICRQQQLTSIADFIATRYGQSSRLSGLVSLISVMAIVPYISLQLTATSQGLGLISQEQLESPAIWADSTFYITLILALFAILFGASRIRPSEHNSGLMASIAFESILKLLAFLTVGIYVCFFVFDSPATLFHSVDQARIPEAIAQTQSPAYVYLSHMLLGFLAMFCLPRQFHVSFIENNSQQELSTARWAFPGYLVLLSLFTLPIAYAGLLLFPDQSTGQDTYVLAIPLEQDNMLMTLVSFLGGFSAAISMVIVSAIVLSIMITNDFINQFILRRAQLTSTSQGLSTQHLLAARRAVIVFVLIASYISHRILSESNSLANIGLLSFSLVAQFAPALLIGLWWRSASCLGAQLGITTGFVIWFYTLLLPAISAGLGWPLDWLDTGPANIAWLAANNLFGLGLDSVTQTLIVSLSLNTLVFFVISVTKGPELAEQLQSNKFVQLKEQPKPDQTKPSLSFNDLASILQRFVDKEAGAAIVKSYFPHDKSVWKDQAPQKTSQLIERELTAIIGGASARLVLEAAHDQVDKHLNQVADFVDEASQVLKFNRDLLQSTIENINQGVSVVDKELNLVAWNKGYKDMFFYPDDALYIGRPIADIIRFNGERGLFDAQDIEAEVSKRLKYLQQGSEYRYQRSHQDGRVFEMQGNPLPGGGFVTTFTDITEYVETQKALEEANTGLEQKVQQRTIALTTANQQLVEAKQVAEQATESKTRFFAAASHDLLQPFNAASLFCSIMEEKTQDHELAELASHIKNSLNSAEDLLSNILELTKLESGALSADVSVFSISRLLQPLEIEFSALARDKGLTLEFNAAQANLKTDRTLLRRVLQNLLSNAIRYTDEGTISVSARIYQDKVEFIVSDTGPGIAQEDQGVIFEEFQQLNSAKEAQGLGLGLAITRRICDVLGLAISVESNLGDGSQFKVLVPVSHEETQRPVEAAPTEQISDFAGLKVWIVDNDLNVLIALQKRLESWGCIVSTASDELSLNKLIEEQKSANLMIMDYQLDGGITGLDILSKTDINIPVIINTANHDESIRELVQDAGLPLLYKPVKVPALRRLIKKLCNEAMA